MVYYNTKRRHSSLGNLAPLTFLKKGKNSAVSKELKGVKLVRKKGSISYGKYFIFFIILLTLIVGIYVWQLKTEERFGVPSNSFSISDSEPQADIDAGSTLIKELRQRQYQVGQITIEQTLASKENYTNYIFSYSSDGLKIYGMLNVPKGNRPFPVIILNHGYFNQSSFTSGDGTQTMADILARNGYLTLASDYRGFGRSENDEQGSRGHNPNYAIDVLNLIASVKNLDEADSERIGMWGHSMGGEVSLRTIEVTNKVKAVVLWAPTSTNHETNSAFYGDGRRSVQGEGDAHNDSDLQFIDIPTSLHQGLSDTEVNPEWSKELNADLEKLDKQVEYFEYPGQDHNFRNLGWDVISKRTVDFFDQYLK